MSRFSAPGLAVLLASGWTLFSSEVWPPLARLRILKRDHVWATFLSANAFDQRDVGRPTRAGAGARRQAGRDVTRHHGGAALAGFLLTRCHFTSATPGLYSPIVAVSD